MAHDLAQRRRIPMRHVRLRAQIAAAVGQVPAGELKPCRMWLGVIGMIASTLLRDR